MMFATYTVKKIFPSGSYVEFLPLQKFHYDLKFFVMMFAPYTVKNVSLVVLMLITYLTLNMIVKLTHGIKV
jgi:hypothetical protein